MQADLLQGQIAQLQQQLQLAAVREQQVQQEAVAAAQDRLEIELRQQQLKYERQIQVNDQLQLLCNMHIARICRQHLSSCCGSNLAATAFMHSQCRERQCQRLLSAACQAASLIHQPHCIACCMLS